VGQHGATLVGNVEKIAMALLTLVILERGIGLLSLFLVIVLFLKEVDEHIFCPVPGLRIKKVKGIVWRWKVAVHAVGHKSLGIIYMRRCLPGIVGELNFMAGGTELRCGSTDHGVVSKAKKGKGNDDPNDNENGGFDKLFHDCVPAVRYEVKMFGFSN
jgi:hypothetical protein